ncbi:MAG: GNAT family N-acetyltransferase [Bradyrhizobium sp.]|jgi:GNAT superfamily N-acetyltransferase|uniref:GNAT family N-acetyltransferase n=1 Tax=Bradyrhizobium sp. TaxID=376 RepID=UPI003C79F3D1
MLKLNLADLGQYSDVVHTRRGEAVTLRFVTPGDADELQAYVRGLSSGSRYKRFLGAMSELPKTVLDDFTHTGRDDRFSLVASMSGDDVERIVGEARYAFHSEDDSVEFGLSVQDRWHGHGIGPALLQNLECRAAALGAISMFGDTLRSNDVMIRLAKKSGYLFRQHPDDWKLVRFEKQIGAGADRSCASLRLVVSNSADRMQAR